MAKRRKKTQNILYKALELAGKPIYLLFTILVVIIFAYFELLTIFTHRLGQPFRIFRIPRFRLPSPNFRFPSFRLRFPKWLAATLFITIFISTSVFAFYWYLLRDLPSPLKLKESLPALSTKIFDRHGTLLYQIYRDENRTLINLEDLPPHLIQATLASEDKNFYSHHGISLRGTLRALVSNLQGYYACLSTQAECSFSLQGGSTITQQLVKNALLSPQQTYTRKIKEAYLAFRTEQIFSKTEILELYFNYVPYGGTAYGIEEAAFQYFGKSSKDLNLSESALLAGLPVAPTGFSPFGTRPYLAKHRQNQVLDAMVEMKYLSPEQSQKTKSESIILKPQGIKILAPHFVMYIKDLLVQEFGEDVVSRGGLEVTTTLDLEKQQILEAEITKELAKLKSLNVHNAAGMITSPPTGEILAMVGSHDFFDTARDGQVNVTLQPRQPGSSIKPITYSLAFMNGLTPNTRIEDTPVCFIIAGSPRYCPTNYDKRFHGSVSLRTALASSYNIPAIKLLNSLGLTRMIELARKMGITTWNDPSRFGLSLTLGGGEVTMYDLTQVYSVFANHGTKVPLKSILSIQEKSGSLSLHSRTLSDSPNFSRFTAQAKESIEEVIPASVAYQISSILSDPLARAPAFGTRSVLNIPGFPVAVKTGTTNSLRDNWTIGYTPNLLVATWVGNNDNAPMSSVASGITGASPIWSNTMKRLLAGTEPVAFEPPTKMVAAVVCPSTGSAYCPDLCPGRPRTEYFVPGTEPKANCNPKKGTLLDSAAQTSNQ